MDGRSIKTLLMGGMNFAEGSGSTVSSGGFTPMYEIYKLVGNNVYPNVVPQNYGTPALVYTITDTAPFQVKGQSTPATTIDVDVEVLGDSYASIIKISTYLMTNLHRYHNIYDGRNFEVTDTWFKGGSPIVPDDGNQYGSRVPQSVGNIQYWGGASIISLDFVNSIEDYDEKLELYRNTLNFKITYLNSPSTSGAICELDFNDTNLIRASIGGDTGVQPAIVDNPILRIFSKAINPTRDDFYNYKNYYQLLHKSGTVLYLRQNSEGNNYIEFVLDNYLENVPAGLHNIFYKECTMFTVVSLPNASTSTLEAAILGASNYTTKCTIWLETDQSIPNFTIYYLKIRVKLVSGTYDYTVLTLLQSIPLDFYADLDWTKPIYIAISIKYVSASEIKINYELINSSSPSDIIFEGYNNEPITLTSTTAGGDFSEGIFSYGSIHDESKGDPLNMYEFSFFEKALDFGSPNYLEVKDYTIKNHKNFNR